ncbi:MAG: hypothetical protein AB7V48_10205 [Sedimentibacter sp.]
MKKIISIILVVVMILGLNINVFAVSSDTLAYEAVLDRINTEYDLNLGYVTVDASKVTLEEYENKIRELAAQQRELLDYIASKETIEPNMEQTEFAPYAVVEKTRTKPTWTSGEYFTITATYNVYDGTRIGTCKDAKINLTLAAILSNVYLTNISAPSYRVIDSGRTSTVSYTATVHYNSIIGIDNVTLYTEFYYSDI